MQNIIHMDIRPIFKHLSHEDLLTIKQQIIELIEYKESYSIKPSEEESIEDFVVDFRKSLLLPKLNGTCKTATYLYFNHKKNIYNPTVEDLKYACMSEMKEIRGFGRNSEYQIIEIAKIAKLQINL